MIRTSPFRSTILACATIATSTAVVAEGAPIGAPQEIRFEVIDVDRNFVLDPAEFDSAFRTPGHGFAYLDLNADGFVTKAEARLAFEDYDARR